MKRHKPISPPSPPMVAVPVEESSTNEDRKASVFQRLGAKGRREEHLTTINKQTGERKLCTHFITKGSCPRRDHCKFLHVKSTANYRRTKRDFEDVIVKREFNNKDDNDGLQPPARDIKVKDSRSSGSMVRQINLAPPTTSRASSYDESTSQNIPVLRSSDEEIYDMQKDLLQQQKERKKRAQLAHPQNPMVLDKGKLRKEKPKRQPIDSSSSSSCSSSTNEDETDTDKNFSVIDEDHHDQHRHHVVEDHHRHLSPPPVQFKIRISKSNVVEQQAKSKESGLRREERVRYSGSDSSRSRSLSIPAPALSSIRREHKRLDESESIKLSDERRVASKEKVGRSRHRDVGPSRYHGTGTNQYPVAGSNPRDRARVTDVISSRHRHKNDHRSGVALEHDRRAVIPQRPGSRHDVMQHDTGFRQRGVRLDHAPRHRSREERQQLSKQQHFDQNRRDLHYKRHNIRSSDQPQQRIQHYVRHRTSSTRHRQKSSRSGGIKEEVRSRSRSLSIPAPDTTPLTLTSVQDSTSTSTCPRPTLSGVDHSPAEHSKIMKNDSSIKKKQMVSSHWSESSCSETETESTTMPLISSSLTIGNSRKRQRDPTSPPLSTQYPLIKEERKQIHRSYEKHRFIEESRQLTMPIPVPDISPLVNKLFAGASDLVWPVASSSGILPYKSHSDGNVGLGSGRQTSSLSFIKQHPEPICDNITEKPTEPEYKLNPDSTTLPPRIRTSKSDSTSTNQQLDNHHSVTSSHIEYGTSPIRSESSSPMDTRESDGIVGEDNKSVIKHSLIEDKSKYQLDDQVDQQINMATKSNATKDHSSSTIKQQSPRNRHKRSASRGTSNSYSTKPDPRAKSREHKQYDRTIESAKARERRRSKERSQYLDRDNDRGRSHSHARSERSSKRRSSGDRLTKDKDNGDNLAESIKKIDEFDLKKELEPISDDELVEGLNSSVVNSATTKHQSSLLGIPPNIISITDSLQVDWSVLTKDTRPFKTNVIGGSYTDQFSPRNIVSTVGISKSQLSEHLVKQIEDLCSSDQKRFTFLHHLGSFHARAVRNAQERSQLIGDVGYYKRALSARRDLLIRRKLCNLPTPIIDDIPNVELGVPCTDDLMKPGNNLSKRINSDLVDIL